MELPTWHGAARSGLSAHRDTDRLDISTRKVDGAVQYLVACIFDDDEGHHEHDNHPRFAEWNKRADAYQIAEPFVFGGDTIVGAFAAAEAGEGPSAPS